MSLVKCATPTNSSKAPSSALTMPLQERKRLAIEAIAGTSTITKLACDADISRKFIYAQKQKAEAALEVAFTEHADNKKVLFHLPITKPWLEQFALSLILICHSSYQGVVEIFRDLLDCSISKGHIHNIIHGVLDQALRINQSQDLSKVRVGAHDEIFQAGAPVLVGCDALSTYCYLLSEEEHRDAVTWGIHLLDLRERQNLKPHHSIADGGAGLRKGQADAWPDVPCHGDVFHALKPLLELTVYLDNRAFETMSAKNSIEQKLARPRRMTEYDKYKALQKKLVAAQEESRKAIQLADDVRNLYQWLREDILSLVGPRLNERQALFDFIVESLHTRESLYAHKIHPVRVFLENHRDNLLAFAKQIDKGIEMIALEFEINPTHVRLLYELQGILFSKQIRWEKDATLRKILGAKFHPVALEVKQVLKDTIRASSVVENLNSRLRNYFTLRRILGREYLTLLQFFLNHRRFMRSERSERVGKSPRELMTGKAHSHWLELLGFKLFKQAA
jgi:hypothetical protein